MTQKAIDFWAQLDELFQTTYGFTITIDGFDFVEDVEAVEVEPKEPKEP